MGSPDSASGKESACLCRRPKRSGFDPWVGKIPWSRKWQPTPLFLPGTFHGQRNLAGCSVWGNRARRDWAHLLLLFRHSIVSNSLQPHVQQHTRSPCPSPSPRVCSTHVHWVGDAIQPSCPLFCTSENVFILPLFLTVFFFTLDT